MFKVAKIGLTLITPLSRGVGSTCSTVTNPEMKELRNSRHLFYLSSRVGKWKIQRRLVSWRVLLCAAWKFNSVWCSCPPSLLISQEPPKPVTWFFFVRFSLAPQSSSSFSYILLLFSSFSCVSSSHKWAEERSMTKSRNVWLQGTTDWNLLPSLEAALQISLVFEHIKEYRLHSRLYRQFFIPFFHFRVILVCGYSRNEKQRYACVMATLPGRRNCERQTLCT